MRHQAHVPDVIFYENIVKITGSKRRWLPFLPAGWIDPKTGKDVEDGRMNLGVVTVNIPRIALNPTETRTASGKIFDERMTVAHQALQFRIMRCKQATPVNAPTLFRFGAFGRLGANDSVDQLFRNERATVSLGYIGLYEATSVFYGKDWMRDHDWDPEGKEFALSIVKRMNELCKDWSTAEGYHYSVYSTPAESLTDRFNRMDREKFGEVDGVTDHDFYTNSFHYPVWLQPTPMEKLDYEKDFHTRVRRLHQLLRIPVPAGQSEGARSGVGLRLHHRHRLSRHEHANRPLLRMRFRR